MRIYLLTALCFVAQMVFASYTPHSSNDTSLFSFKNKILTIDGEKSLSNGTISNPSIEFTRTQRKKLRLKQRIENFLFRHRIKEINGKSKSDFNFWGLLLGITLGPLGILISYISTKKKNVRKWSVVGCVIDIGAGILFSIMLIAIFATF